MQEQQYLGSRELVDVDWRERVAPDARKVARGVGLVGVSFCYPKPHRSCHAKTSAIYNVFMLHYMWIHYVSFCRISGLRAGVLTPCRYRIAPTPGKVRVGSGWLASLSAIPNFTDPGVSGVRFEV